MTPAKRRPATPASQGPTRVAPDVPIVADPPDVEPPPVPTAAEPPPVPTAAEPPPVPSLPVADGGLRAPDAPTAPPDDPVPDVLVTAPVPPAETTPPTETGQADAEDRATTQSPGRSRGRYPLPVWPD